MLPAGFVVIGCILRVCGSVFPARKLRERKRKTRKVENHENRRKARKGFRVQNHRKQILYAFGKRLWYR